MIRIAKTARAMTLLLGIGLALWAAPAAAQELFSNATFDLGTSGFAGPIAPPNSFTFDPTRDADGIESSGSAVLTHRMPHPPGGWYSISLARCIPQTTA